MGFFEVTHTHTISLKGGVISLAVFSTGISVVYYFFKRRNKPAPQPLKEMLFFPDPHPTCRALYTERQGCHDPTCQYSHDPNSSFCRLVDHLLSARQSVDMCIFCFTSPELASAVITLHQRGVHIRLITDKEQVDASNSQVGKFRKEGIIVRTNSTSYLMHHKFIVIDKKKLVNGSFNWTRQAVMGNNENVLITMEPSHISQFLSEFEKLWVEFNPSKQ